MAQGTTDNKGTGDGQGTNSTNSGEGSGTPNPKGDGGTDSSGGEGEIDYAAKYEEERAKGIALQGQLNAAAEEKDKAERSKLTGEQNMQRDLDRLTKIAEEYDKFKKTTYLKLQVIEESGDKYKWNPRAIDDVVNSVDLEKITFGELKDGALKIDGLDLELKRIAKEKDYLLQAIESSDEKGDKGGGSGSGNPSGALPFGSSDGKSKSDADLMKKYKIA